ncbi:Caudovirales tail fiber assembly protein [compost metagenome]
MGNYQFSATTTSFYPVSLLDSYEQAGTLPPDLVDVTDETYAEFTGQPPEGKMRGSKGKNPGWVDIPPPTPEETRQGWVTNKARLLDEADAIIRRLEWAVKHDMATAEEKAKLEAWERYSVLLSRVDVDNPDWPAVP